MNQRPHTLTRIPEQKSFLHLLFIGLVGVSDLHVEGMTLPELRQALHDAYAKVLHDPIITVSLANFQKPYFVVLGEVSKPGPVLLVPNMTVLQVLSVAGGLSQYANEKKIYVLRKENGKETRLLFDYRQAVEGRGPGRNIVLKPGDTIVVP